MEALAQFIVAGLKSGAIYALLALGFTIVYASTGAINFAQGEFFMLGGVIGVWLLSLGMPIPLAVLGAIVLTAAIGVVFEILAVRPIEGGDPLRIIMVTIGGSVLLRQLALHAFGPDELTFPAFTRGPSIRLLGAAIERQTVWIWGLTLLAVLALAAMYRYTGFGKAMRATSIRSEAARLVGIDAAGMVTASFGLSAALGAMAGLVVAPLTQTAFNVGSAIGLKGFAAAILGGLGNPVAAVGGGLILGVLESLTAGYIDPLYKDAVALVVLLLVLFIRPQGLFGGAAREKV
ncbi:MAG: branched-chain amino acid ABC transporter permease [Coriobacteriales bacterium]|nr:branched-chain amino acid ABC transporter permease [Coriobacteriales bacterium]